MNGLEFCYRTLVDHLGFSTDNICVLNYNASLQAFGDPQDLPISAWPGDGTPYRMVVNAEGSRDAFQHALRIIGKKLTPDDQLFINTTGHGGNHGDGDGPDLITYPHCRRYKSRDFCADLGGLPSHRSLVVLMAQCFSGGFNRGVIDASRAASTFIASATSETRQSFMSLEDCNWDSFQRNWIAGLRGRDVDGAAIETYASRTSGGPINVGEAFRYASTCPGRNLYDSPEFAASSDSAGEMTLSEDATTVPIAL